ncbi:T9SS type A sorting domain-containing protein [Rubrivirga sp. IMCC45206]|uniref:T9SS type A sorting domain-containing protein n=1 Tax=Rubrivirga sp. IMCC45206 TaxID=3391614 RepID=UPI00398FA8CA
MTLSTLRSVALALALGLAAPAAAQSPVIFTVTSTADDSNARDANPGDGQCVDTFTDSNPSAEPRCTLRAAVDEANALGGDVVINLPGQLAGGASGNYTLARVAPNDADNTYEDDNAYGDLDLDNGGSITIRGTGTPGPTVTISPNDRVFHLLSGTVRIERTTITGGTAQAGDNGVSSPGPGESVDGEDGADGGCVLVADGVTATLDQVSINNCFTQSGGNGAAPAAADTPGGNAGNGGNGGAVANYGTLTVTRAFFYSNGTGDAGSAANGTAGSGDPVAGGNGGNGGLGGALFTAGTLTVEETTIVNNAGGDPSTGAAGTNGGPDGYDGEGGAGGGIAAINGGTVSLRNAIVASNAAGDDVNNPETGNTPSASKQPGSDLYDGTPADDDTVSPGFPPYTPGVFTDGGNNLVGSNNSVEATFPDTAPGTDVDQNGSIIGSGQIDAPTRVDPGITGSNQNEDYTVAAIVLASGSPAVDAGANTDLSGDDIRVDGRGFRRPGTSSGDTTVDIGGFELDSRPVMGDLVVNELDSVTAPSDEDDRAEFVEIKNTGDFEAQLADYALVLYSGDDDAAYASYNLSGALAPGETIIVGDPGVTNVSQELFTGTPDDVRDEDGAVGLFLGKASDYPVGAVAGQNKATRVDVLVYDNGQQASLTVARMSGSSLAEAFGQSEDDVASGDTDGTSIQRANDGSYQAGAPTPGEDTGAGTGGGGGTGSPVVTLSIGQDRIREGESVTVTATLDRTTTGDVTVDLASTNTADLTGPGTITIPAGETSASVSYTAVADSQPETDETVTLSIDAVSNGVEDGAQSVNVVVVDQVSGTGQLPPTTTSADVPARDADGDGVEDGGVRLVSLPVDGVTAGELADAAGGDVFAFDPATGTFVPADDATVLDAGQPVVVEVAPGATISLDGTAPSGPTTFATATAEGDAADRVLVSVGNPTDGALSLADLQVVGGTFADDVLVLDAGTGAFRAVALGDLASATIPAFGAVILQVTPDGDAGDVSVSAASPSAATGRDLTETETEADVLVTLTGEDVGDVLAVSFDGADGLDPADAVDVDSPTGATLSALADGLALAALALDGGVMTGETITVPLSVSGPAGTYTLAVDTSTIEVDGLTVAVALLDNGMPVGGSADVTLTGGETDRFALRFSVQGGVATGPGPGVTAVGSVFPNPTAGASALEVSVAEAQVVRVSVYDVLGRSVGVAFDGTVTAGDAVRVELGARLSPGTYVVRVEGASFAETRRFTVTR